MPVYGILVQIQYGMHTCAGNGDPDAALPSALITPANALVDQPAGITVGLLDTGVDAGDSALTGRLDLLFRR